MSDHPFVRLRAASSEVASGALSAERLAKVVESIRLHGAAIIDGAVKSFEGATNPTDNEKPAAVVNEIADKVNRVQLVN